MGTIHKFTPPPKNQNQFKGFRPLGPMVPERKPARWKKLRPWQQGLIIWTLLIVVAAGFVGMNKLFAALF